MTRTDPHRVMECAAHQGLCDWDACANNGWFANSSYFLICSQWFGPGLSGAGYEVCFVVFQRHNNLEPFVPRALPHLAVVFSTFKLCILLTLSDGGDHELCDTNDVPECSAFRVHS